MAPAARLVNAGRLIGDPRPPPGAPAPRAPPPPPPPRRTPRRSTAARVRCAAPGRAATSASSHAAASTRTRPGASPGRTGSPSADRWRRWRRNFRTLQSDLTMFRKCSIVISTLSGDRRWTSYCLDPAAASLAWTLTRTVQRSVRLRPLEIEDRVLPPVARDARRARGGIVRLQTCARETCRDLEDA